MAGARRRKPPAVRVSRRTESVLGSRGLTLEDARRMPDVALRRVLGIGPMMFREIRAAVGGPEETEAPPERGLLMAKKREASKPPKATGSSLDREILATLKELSRKLTDIT